MTKLQTINRILWANNDIAPRCAFFFTYPPLSSKAWRSSGHSVSHRCPSLLPASGLELHSLHPLASPLLSLSLSHSLQSGSAHLRKRQMSDICDNFNCASCHAAQVTIKILTDNIPLPKTCGLLSSHSGCLPWCCSILPRSKALLCRFWNMTSKWHRSQNIHSAKYSHILVFIYCQVSDTTDKHDYRKKNNDSQLNKCCIKESKSDNFISHVRKPLAEAQELPFCVLSIFFFPRLNHIISEEIFS